MRCWIKKGRQKEKEKRKRVIREDRAAAAETSGCQSIRYEGLQGPMRGSVWSVSFKARTAGKAITDDLPLAAGPDGTLTESNHKQVNSTSTFLIFFSTRFFLLVSFCLLKWRTALPYSISTYFSPFFKKWNGSQLYFQCLFKSTLVAMPCTSQG